MPTRIVRFDITQVDIAQITSKREDVPIVILFNKKSDRTNLYK